MSDEMKENSDKRNEEKDLKQSLWQKIESERVCPRPKWYFFCLECSLWLLWFLSVVVGSLSLAAAWYVISYQQYAFYELTHRNFLAFAVDTLPYVWLITFFAMAYLSVYNLKRTRRGYRYSTVFILGSSLAFSLLGGYGLQHFNLGHEIDETVGRHMPVYKTLGKTEEMRWQHPEQGRLLGRQVLSTLSPTTTIIFADVTGVRWRFDITELPDYDVYILKQEQKVRVLGKRTDDNTPVFHACAVFPSVMVEDMNEDKLMAEREHFINRLSELSGYYKENRTENSICAGLAVLQRRSKQ